MPIATQDLRSCWRLAGVALAIVLSGVVPAWAQNASPPTGRIEGTISVPENRVTIGRHGVIQAHINAREVVIMGTVSGNVECSDRLDIRGEGSLTGDVITERISVEDGALMKGSIQVRHAEHKAQQPKAMGAAAGA